MSSASSGSFSNDRAVAGADAGTYLHPQTLARLASIELRAKLIVEGVMNGMHRSPYHGFSVEFAQHRPYTAGDDLRHLDWKLLGRSDKLHLKQYEQETNLDLALLVDSSGSMNYGSRSYASASGTGDAASHRGSAVWTKYDHATATAAAIAFLAIRQGDRVGLGMFADKLFDAIDRSSAREQWRKIVRTLSVHPVEQGTDLPRVMDQTLGKLNNRCLIVLVSDFYTEPESIRVALARAKHRRHDVMLMQVVDEKELTFDLDGAAPFEGLEGEGRVRVDPRSIRSAYLEAIETHNAKVAKIARSFGFDYHRLVTEDWLGPSLGAFMNRRAAMLKRRSV
ncbi:MAG: DUF58 domain-containing protein [Planctomycetota bacterium]